MMGGRAPVCRRALVLGSSCFTERSGEAPARYEVAARLDDLLAGIASG